MQEIIKLSLFVNKAGEHTERNDEKDKKKNAHSQKLESDCMKPDLAHWIH